MDKDFWHGRWREGRIGFHEGAPNTLLSAHASELGEGTRVFAPLCGKTEDMAFLAARGHAIVGVELAEQAVRAFFAEHGLEPTIESSDRFSTYRAGAFELRAGDFFALEAGDLGGASAVYDRAALVALPDVLRTRYAAHLRALLPAGSRMLVVTFVYPQELREGPPFSVDEPELARLFAGAELTRLASRDVTSGAVAAAGIAATEHAWRIVL